MIKRLAIKGIIHELTENITIKGAAAFYEGYVVPMAFQFQDITLYKEEECVSFSADLLDVCYNSNYMYLPEYLNPYGKMDVSTLNQMQLVIYVDAPLQDWQCELSFIIGYDEEDAILMENIEILPSREIPEVDYPIAYPA